MNELFPTFEEMKSGAKKVKYIRLINGEQVGDNISSISIIEEKATSFLAIRSMGVDETIVVPIAAIMKICVSDRAFDPEIRRRNPVVKM